jgi:hypothetical protein
MKLKFALAALTGLAALGAGPGAMAIPSTLPVDKTPALNTRTLTHIRAVTAKYHNIALAEDAGYVPFKDVNGVSCISMPGMGAMGVHYVNPALIDDPAIDPAAPEALVYAPDRDGTLRLAALEYLVPRKAWNAHHATPPALFQGHPFAVTQAPNRYGLPTFYSQHVWAWKANPVGPLAMWNPNVHCAA